MGLEGSLCDGKEGAAHWAEDMVEICVRKDFRGSAGDRPGIAEGRDQ